MNEWHMHIGAVIKEVIDRKEVNVSHLAEQMNMQRNNLYSIFKRESITSDLLMEFSVLLEYDFFSLLSAELAKKVNTQNDKEVTVKVTLSEQKLLELLGKNPNTIVETKIQ